MLSLRTYPEKLFRIERIKTRKKSTSIHYGDHKSGFKGAGRTVDQWRPGQPSRTSWVLSRTYPEKLFRIRMEPKELRTLFVADRSCSSSRRPRTRRC